MLKRKKQEDPRTQEARGRAARISTHELFEWADMAQFTMGKGLHEFQSNWDINFLEEALFAAQVALVIVEELHVRKTI